MADDQDKQEGEATGTDDAGADAKTQDDTQGKGEGTTAAAGGGEDAKKAGSTGGGSAAKAAPVSSGTGDDGSSETSRWLTAAAVALAVVLLTGVTAYFMGRRAGRERAEEAGVDAADARREKREAVAEAQADVREAERKLEELRTRTLRLDAHRSLSVALGHLDDRNFGLADEARAEAVQMLEESDADGDWARVQKRISEMEFVVASDLFRQRLAVHEALRQMGALLAGRPLPTARELEPQRGRGGSAGDADGDGADQAASAGSGEGSDAKAGGASSGSGKATDASKDDDAEDKAEQS